MWHVCGKVPRSQDAEESDVEGASTRAPDIDPQMCPHQVLWLQRVKELKVQCEGLREEASIAASNSVSGSVEFSQGEFASRILASLSNLIAFTQV